ncbi:MAG: sulfotransferase [Pirellulaceae bacterium]
MTGRPIASESFGNDMPAAESHNSKNHRNGTTVGSDPSSCSAPHVPATSPSTDVGAKQGEEAKINAYPAMSPRFWHGMRVGCWWRLLAKNGFRIALSRLPIAMGVSFFTPGNDVLAGLQSLIHGRRIRETPITAPPIFILGHWRSGTTLLHELLVTDPRFACPNTYQCFAPSHFIVSEAMMVRFGSFLLPKKRPMDNMETGWLLPQEDEFALMNLGVPSPYLRIAFPQTQPPALDYLTLTDLSDKQRSEWRNKLMWFMRALTYHYSGKQMVLKSPRIRAGWLSCPGYFHSAQICSLDAQIRAKLFLSLCDCDRSEYRQSYSTRSPRAKCASTCRSVSHACTRSLKTTAPKSTARI